MKVSVKNSIFKGVRVYINDYIHFKFRPSKILFFQAWEDWDGKKWCIEFHTRTKKTYCEYDKKETWIEILKLIKKYI